MDRKIFSPRPWNKPNHRSYDRRLWLSSQKRIVINMTTENLNENIFQADSDDVTLLSDMNSDSSSSGCFDSDESIEAAREGNVSVPETEFSFTNEANKRWESIDCMQSTFRQENLPKKYAPDEKLVLSPIAASKQTKIKILRPKEEPVTSLSVRKSMSEEDSSFRATGRNFVPVQARRMLRSISNKIDQAVQYPKRRKKSRSVFGKNAPVINIQNDENQNLLPVEIHLNEGYIQQKKIRKDNLASTPNPINDKKVQNDDNENESEIKLSPIRNLDPLFGEVAANDASTVNSREILAELTEDDSMPLETCDIHKFVEKVSAIKKKILRQPSSPKTFLKNSNVYLERVVCKKFFLDSCDSDDSN